MGEKEVISRRGLVKKHAAIDHEIWQWKLNLERTRISQGVTKADVQAFAVEAYRRAGVTTFKASNGWYRRWRARWKNADFIISNNVSIKKKEPGSNTDVEDNLKETDDDSVEKQSEIKDKPIVVNTIRNDDDKTKQNNVNFQNTFDTTQKIANHKKSFNLQLRCTDTDAETLQLKSQEKEETISKPRLFNVVSIKKIKRPEPKILKSDSGPLSINIKNKEKNKRKCKKILQMGYTDIKNLSSTCHSSLFVSKSLSKLNNSVDVISNARSDSYDNDSKVNNVKLVNCNLQTISFLNTNFQDPLNSEFSEKNEKIDHKSLGTTINIYKKVNNEIEGDNKLEVHNVISGDIGLAFSSQVVQSNNGVPVLSARKTVDSSNSLSSSVYDENHLDFEEHELFCDSCEDFHPRHASLHTGCKQKKESTSSFLLNCVFEKKDLIVLPDNPLINTNTEGDTLKNSPDSIKLEEETYLCNPRTIAPKGKRYLITFKSKVVNYALSNNLKKAAEHFKVNRNTVSEWLAERKRFTGVIPSRLLKNQDIPSDSEFLKWLEDSKFNITNELIKQKTSEWLLNNQACKRQCHWLRMYAHRLNGLEDQSLKKRYIAYPEPFKRAVVFHAQTHSNAAAARVFGVARRRIVEWQELTGETRKKSKRKVANNVTDETVDKQVFEWFQKQHPPPSSQQVRSKALDLFRAAGIDSVKCSAQWYYRWRARHKLLPSRDELYSNTTPLLIWALSELDNNKYVSHSSLAAQAALLGHSKVSRGWTFRFCKKHHQLLQSVPSADTPLPAELEYHVRDFRQNLLEVISSRAISESRIVALDEIPLHFLPKDHGKKPLLIRHPGFESCQGSLMVSCLADGTLLPVLFVFKGHGPECTLSNTHVIATVSDTGQVSDSVMKEWLSSVCFNNLGDEGGLLVTDSFEVHTTPSVKEDVTSHGVELIVIPPGCASRLLPAMSVCLSFKTMLEDLCQTFLSNQNATLQSPSADQLYLWAVRVHKHFTKLHKEKIRNTFKNMLLH